MVFIGTFSLKGHARHMLNKLTDKMEYITEHCGQPTLPCLELNKQTISVQSHLPTLTAKSCKSIEGLPMYFWRQAAELEFSKASDCGPPLE